MVRLASACSPWSRNPDPTRVRKTETVKCEHRIAGEVCALARTEHGLHELVLAGTRDVLKPVKAVPDAFKPTSVMQLAQLDGRYSKSPSVPCRDVAILIQRTFTKPATVCLSEFHTISLPKPYRYRYGFVIFTLRHRLDASSQSGISVPFSVRF